MRNDAEVTALPRAFPPDPMDALCPSRQVLDLIADKWSVLVIAAIGRGADRNGSLLRTIGGISQKSLTRSLRNLERNGLVTRHDFHELPPRVEYRLSELGHSLQPVFSVMCQWAVESMPHVVAAQRRHDLGR